MMTVKQRLDMIVAICDAVDPDKEGESRSHADGGEGGVERYRDHPLWYSHVPRMGAEGED